MSINYSEIIPNNVNLADNKTLQQIGRAHV